MRRSRNEVLISLWGPFLCHQRCASTDVKQPYRRRSSDPQTIREKRNFQRDMKFSKQRPLPTAPWLQDKKRTYMDDAERLYGRKETWCKIKDEALREKLASLLQDYLKDMIDATKVEVRNAKKYMRLSDQLDAEYRSYVAAATFSSPHLLRSWAKTVCQNEEEEKRMLTTSDDSHDAFLSEEDADGTAPRRGEAAGGGNENDEEEEKEHEETRTARKKFLEARRRQGEEAILENTPATMDLLREEKRNAPYSAFPFLRQRAMEEETTLDPSLVDWTAKYFPDDDDRTFSFPPKLHMHTEEKQERGGDGHGGSSNGVVGDLLSGPKPSARRRLQRSLRLHEDMHRPTFDAEGFFYRVRRQSNEEDRAPKPRAARGSDAHSDRDREVVKVPWDTVVKAKEQGYSADILRAKERLVRLSRGRSRILDSPCMLATCLKGHVIKYSADNGAGIIRPLLQSATSVYSPTGLLMDVKPGDQIMFSVEDVHMTCMEQTVHAKCEKGSLAIVPVVAKGCFVRFSLQHDYMTRRNFGVGATPVFQAKNIVVMDESSLQSSSHYMSKLEWLTWKDEERRLNDLLHSKNWRGPPSSASHAFRQNSHTIMPIDF